MIGEEKDVKVERIPVGRIRPRRPGVRRDPVTEEVKRLASSVKKHGLLHPILVRPDGRMFEVVCGQRRFLACRHLGMGEVPAMVRALDDRQALELSVAENARREALSPDERQDILKRLAEYFPGRRREELEGWLGGVDADGDLPGWLDTLPATAVRGEDVSVVVAPSRSGESSTSSSAPRSGETRLMVAPGGMVLRRLGLVWRIRTLLNKLGRSGQLDTDLLKNIVGELFEKFDRQPIPDFLDLSYRARTKRYVSRHCLNVSKLALFLAHSLGLPRAEIEQVVICGLLHDVGMMKVKEEVFTKHAALDQEEWEQVKGHPVEGALLLTKEVVLRDVVARVALEHHEKPDGSGYPKGKKKEEIHLYARLINVVDTYGAMVSPRAHRLPLLPHQAMRVVMDDGAKGMLDWDIVQAFVRAMSIYPIGSYVRLQGGEIARVVRAQPEIPEKPVIAVVADAQRNILPAPVEIDLAMSEPVPTFEPIPSPV